VSPDTPVTDAPRAPWVHVVCLALSCWSRIWLERDDGSLCGLRKLGLCSWEEARVCEPIGRQRLHCLDIERGDRSWCVSSPAEPIPCLAKAICVDAGAGHRPSSVQPPLNALAGAAARDPRKDPSLRVSGDPSSGGRRRTSGTRVTSAADDLRASAAGLAAQPEPGAERSAPILAQAPGGAGPRAPRFA
jgi:hypothetical protein